MKRGGALAVLCLLLGCSGLIGDGGDDALTSSELECSSMIVPMRRLSREQYVNTITDLFGGSVVASDHFPDSSEGYAFASYADANGMSLPAAEGMMMAAEDVALQAVADLASLLPCDPASADRVCVEELVRALGRRAFRRPLSERELGLLMTNAYDLAQGKVADGVALVITTMLQMPQFLYLIEEGVPSEDGLTSRLTDHEIASRLSYLLWGTMPDEELLAAADAGQLHDKAQIEAQARRLLADRARSVPALVSFVQEWVGLDEFSSQAKSASVFPEYEALAPYLEEESLRFIEHVLTEGSGTLEELFTSTQAFVNQPLEDFYGLPPQSTGVDDWRAVSLDENQRPGLFTRAAVMATYAHSELPSPTLRGKFVRIRLMCEKFPSPPKQAATVEVQGDTALERSQWLMNDPFCGSCHGRLDGIGIGLMNYDAIGRWDATESPSGDIVGTEGGSFATPSELVHELAASEEVAECAVTQMFRYAVARDDTPADRCHIGTLHEGLLERGGDLRELMVAIVTHDAFVVRRLEEETP